MSSNDSTFSIELRPARSLRILRGLLLSTGLAALAASHLAWPWRLMIAGALVAALWWSEREANRRGPARLLLQPDGRAALHDRDGRRIDAQLAGHGYLGTLAIVLWLRADGARFASRLFIPRDAMDADEFRRLRAALRLGLVGLSGAPRSPA